ncbi:MAG: lipopolysaccharide biosynthesis protein [Actinobacteria bacterium]|nr:lipopolysaccharide biosynthesis protein [Actinomycetota bacterium]
MTNSALTVVLSRIGSVTCGFFTLTLTAWGLGPSGRGVVATGISLMLLFPLLLSGGLPSVMRRIWALQPPASAAQHLLAARALALPLAAVSGLVATALLPVLAPSASSGIKWVLVGCIVTCTGAGTRWLNDGSALLGSGRVGAYSLVLLTPSVLLAVVSLWLWATGELSVVAVLIAQAGAYLITAVASHLLVKMPSGVRREPLLRVLREGLPYFGSQVAEALSYRLDQVLVLGVIGAFGAGIYSISATVALLPSTLGLAVASATFQQVAAQHQRDGRLADGSVVRVSLLAGAILTLVLAAAAPYAIPIAFGQAFASAVIPTWIGLIGALFLVGTQASASILIASGRGWHLTLAQVIGLGVGVLLLLIMGPRFGATGAAWASATGFFTTFIIALWATRLPLSELLPRGSDVSRTVQVFVSGSLEPRRSDT